MRNSTLGDESVRNLSRLLCVRQSQQAVAEQRTQRALRHRDQSVVLSLLPSSPICCNVNPLSDEYLFARTTGAVRVVSSLFVPALRKYSRRCPSHVPACGARRLLFGSVAERACDGRRPTPAPVRFLPSGADNIIAAHLSVEANEQLRTAATTTTTMTTVTTPSRGDDEKACLNECIRREC